MKERFRKVIVWIACLAMVLTMSTGMVFATDDQAEAITNDSSTEVADAAESSIVIELADGSSITIDAATIKAAESVEVTAEEPFTDARNRNYVGTFYKLTDILISAGIENISDAHGISTVASDGFTNGFNEEELENLYIYDMGEVYRDGKVQGESGTYGTALNGGQGNKWAKDIVSVEIASDHVWFFKDGTCMHYCSICGDAEPSITVGETKIYDCQIKAATSIEATEENPWTNARGNKYVGTFYKLTDILESAGVENIADAHGISTTASDGFTNGFAQSDLNNIYIYDMGEVLKNGSVAGDSGKYATALNGGQGNKWANDIVSVAVINEHQPFIKGGKEFTYCSICGEELFKVDNATYTLPELIANAADGDTVTLDHSATYTDDISIDVGGAGKTVTIDLGETTLTLKDSNESKTLSASNGNLVITGGTFDGSLGDNVKADGGFFTYELPEANCTDGKAPVYDLETGLYEVKTVSAYDAQIIANELQKKIAELIKEIEELNAKLNSTVTRIYGDSRYSTAFKNADMLKDLQGGENFNTVVITTGANYPDALSGSYLATKNNAPLLLINSSSAESVREYISENVNAGGRIIVLGGEGAVASAWLDDLEGYTVDRIAGNSRYETNLKILEEVGYTGGDILVATASNYADSLSGSSLDMPILLVNGKGSLTDDQIKFLSGKNAQMYIAGGTGAITDDMEASLGTYGTVVKRIAGSSRYETSKLMADEFFADATTAVLTVGNNFPDGLSAGPVAAKLGAPLLLTNNGSSSYAAAYATSHGINSGIVIGGPGANMISDETAAAVFSNNKIDVYEEGRY